MIVKVVRHGETDLNQPIKKMQGISNYDLNENGIEQAKYTRDKLAKEKFDIIISSPLERAKHTAEIINEPHHLNIIFDDRIKERDYGTLEGQEIKTEYFDFNYDFESIDGEALEVYTARIKDFISDVKNKYANKNVLIVCHNGVIRMIRCILEGIPEDNNTAQIGISNGEIKEFVF